MEDLYLMHYGVPGMKWGVITKQIIGSQKTRKAIVGAGTTALGAKIGSKISKSKYSSARSNSAQNRRIDKKVNRRVKNLNSNYKKEEYRSDYLRNKKMSEVKRINKRMNKGKTHDQAVNAEIGRKAALSILKSVGGQLATVAAATYITQKVMQRANSSLPKLEYNVITLGPEAFRVLN